MKPLYLITALLISMVGANGINLEQVKEVNEGERTRLEAYFVANDYDAPKVEELWDGISINSGGRITKISWINKGLTGNLNVSGFTALQELNCENNKLTSIDANECTALTVFDCSENKISSINVSGCGALLLLESYNNPLTKLDLSGCTALTRLNSSKSNLTKLDLSDCVALISFICDENKLTKLDVTGCTALENLYCNDNNLTELKVNGCTNLRKIYCYNNNLTSVDLSGCTALETLYCYNNYLSESVIEGIMDQFPNLTPDEGFYFSPQKELPVSPPGIYHTVDLVLAPGITVNQTAGELTIEDGDHLFLQFHPEDPTLTAEDILFRVDGVETAFKRSIDERGGSFILNPIHQDREVLIALRQYGVTIPTMDGARCDRGSGCHWVAYESSFRFCLTLDEGQDPTAVEVLANGEALTPDALRAEMLTYTLEAVTGPVEIVVNGLLPTSNTKLTHGIRLEVKYGKLKVENETATAIDLSVYTLTGKLYISRSLPKGTTLLSLPAGIYIVRAGEERWKIMIN